MVTRLTATRCTVLMVIESNPGGWLTARRLRAHGTILALCLWSLYLWNLASPGLRDRNGNLKGTDFLHLYTLGSLAMAHRGSDLYDMNAQAVLAAQRVPEAAGVRYLPLYPPQVSLFFAPLAHLSYGWALIVWWACSAIIYAAACYSIWRACPNLRDYGRTVVILAAAFPAFFHMIAWGQTSALALACFTLAFFLLRAKRDFLTGVVLGLLIFKPQLGLAAVVVFVSLGAWKILAGAVLSAAAQLGAGCLYYGTNPLRQWIRALRSAPAVLPLLEPKPYQTHNLRTFWTMLIPGHDLSLALYILSAAAVLGLTVVCWRRSPSAPLALRYSSLLLATVLVAPHLTVYDLVILAPAFLLLADWLTKLAPNSSTRTLGTLLYLVYMLPLLGPLAMWTHVQLSVVAMAAVVYAIWRISRQGASALTA
ncbi:MAG: glycosyltransferase family 87 protein [Candidatus Sulfotelmatobacter sp.]